MSSESKIDEKNNNSEIKSKNNEEEVKKEEESVIKSPIQSKKRSGSPVQPTEKEIAAKAKELAAKAAFDASEIIRLSKLIDQYEKENFRLRKELEFSHNAQKANMDKMRDQELIRQGLAKQIKSLESTIKFDRIATDGLTKKAGTLDFELTNAKVERKLLIEEQILNREKVKHLEGSLNDDRSKRLKEMHENELLRISNAELEAIASNAEAKEIAAQKELLTKIQNVESVMATNDMLKKTIEAQSSEMLALCREIFGFKEKQRQLSETILILEGSLQERLKERDNFEAEGWRLRRELLSIASTQSEKSQAFSRSSSQSRQGYRPSTTSKGLSGAVLTAHMLPQMSSEDRDQQVSPSPTGNGGKGVSEKWKSDSKRIQVTIESLQSVDDDKWQIKSSNMSSPKYLPMISPSASAFRPYTVTANNFVDQRNKEIINRDRGSMSSPQIDRLSKSLNSLTIPSPLQYDSSNDINALSPGSPMTFGDTTPMKSDQFNSTTNIDKKLNKESINTPIKKSQNKISSKGKSTFVGSGLGFKRENAAIGSKGSAKETLMRIMAEFEANN